MQQKVTQNRGNGKPPPYTDRVMASTFVNQVLMTLSPRGGANNAVCEPTSNRSNDNNQTWYKQCSILTPPSVAVLLGPKLNVSIRGSHMGLECQSQLRRCVGRRVRTLCSSDECSIIPVG